MRARTLFAIALAAAIGCGTTAGASPTPAPSPLPQAELKERVMDAAGRIEFCDPDYYPIARADEEQLAKQRIGDVQKDADAYAAISRRVGTDTLAVYREWKALNALVLTARATTPQSWSFAYAAKTTARGATPAPKGNLTHVAGTVDVFGKVDVTQRTPTGGIPCPICLAAGTRIATPRGEVAVEDLRMGDLVWTLEAGRRVARPLVAIGRTPVPPTHEVVRLALSDGRVALVSPGHPTADGRRVGALREGDALDSATVVSAERAAYAGGFTFDVLPGSESGAYWANGMLLGSTLR